MNADDLELLVRRSLERDATTQPPLPDLLDRSVAYGRRITRRRQAAGAALVVLIVLVAVLSVAVTGGGKKVQPSVPPKPSPTTTLTLSSIADHVQGLPDEGQAASPWWYERILAKTATRSDVAELWQSRAGKTEVLLDGTSTKVAVHSLGEGNVGSNASWVTDNLRATTPAAFYARTKETVLNDVGSDVAALPLAGDLFGRIEPLLELGEFPPASRATLLRALAMVPSVRLQGLAKDATGRTGVLVVPPNAGFTANTRYLIDPATGLVIETQTLDAQGAVTGRTTFAASAAVPAAHALPKAMSAVTPHAPAPLASGQTVLRLP